MLFAKFSIYFHLPNYIIINYYKFPIFNGLVFPDIEKREVDFDLKMDADMILFLYFLLIENQLQFVLNMLLL